MRILILSIVGRTFLVCPRSCWHRAGLSWRRWRICCVSSGMIALTVVPAPGAFFAQRQDVQQDITSQKGRDQPGPNLTYLFGLGRGILEMQQQRAPFPGQPDRKTTSGGDGFVRLRSGRIIPVAIQKLEGGFLDQHGTGHRVQHQTYYQYRAGYHPTGASCGECGHGGKDSEGLNRFHCPIPFCPSRHYLPLKVISLRIGVISSLAQ